MALVYTVRLWLTANRSCAEYAGLERANKSSRPRLKYLFQITEWTDTSKIPILFLRSQIVPPGMGQADYIYQLPLM